MTSPTFLITNDDGIDALGIRLLTEAAAAVGDTVVVAPAGQMSAISHAITLGSELKVERRGVRRYAVHGRPADCVYLGVRRILADLRGELGDGPVMVLSGINHGPNLGYDLMYSGTVAGATEGLVQGLTSLAFSYAGKLKEAAQGELKELISSLLRRLCAAPSPSQPHCLNINIPTDIVGIRGLWVTVPGRRIYNANVIQTFNAQGAEFLTIGSGVIESPSEPGTDIEALNNGYISVTPMKLDFCDRERLDEVTGLHLGPDQGALTD